jgi:putative transposase
LAGEHQPKLSTSIYDPCKPKALQPPVESAQYTSFAFTQRLVDAGADASIGSIGDGYDNAVAESTIGLYKTELINMQGPWKTIEQVELATLEWVDWYNHRRLHGACERLPPAEFEQTRQTQSTQ